MTELVKADHGSRGHAKRSPSGLKNYEQCGEYKAQEWEQEKHPVTVEGTKLHEHMDMWGNGSNEALTLGLTDEQSRLVSMCAGYCRSLPSFGFDVVVEPELDIVEGMWGFCDRLQFSKNRTHVDLLDWKFGYNPVEDAEVNSQGQAYALGVFKKYKKEDVRTITVHFVQPRIDYITFHTFSREDIPWLESRILGIMGNSGKYFYNEDICQYCGNWECPIKTNAALTLSRQYITELPVPANVHSSTITRPEDMAKLLDLVPQIEAWCKSVRHHAKELIETHSVEIPGYETFYKNGAAKVLDVGLVYDIVSRDYGITVDQFMELISSVPLGELKDLVAKHAPRGEKQSCKDRLIADLVECEAIQPGAESLTLRKIKTKITNNNHEQDVV